MSANPQPAFGFRALPPEEWHKLKAVYDEDDAELPDPALAVIYVFEMGGVILGSFAVHKVLVTGLVWTEEGMRGLGIAKALSDYVDECFPEGQHLFAVISNSATESIAKKRGMVEVKGKLFRKDY